MLSSQVQEPEKSLSPTPSIYMEAKFYHRADVLREQLERQVLGCLGGSGGPTPLAYAFCENRYKFLTASAGCIFAPDTLKDLIDGLHSWGTAVLGISHVSTPQMRVYIQGCSRSLLRDSVNAPWHYALSLTRRVRGQTGWLKVLTNSITRDLMGHLSIGRVVSSRMEFNQLLVHRASNPYGIRPVRTSMNPLEGCIFLDGYFW